jgi:hypothetical protein
MTKDEAQRRRWTFYEAVLIDSVEKIAKANLYLSTIKPGETTEGSLDVTIPKKAIKGKALAKMEINLVYIPPPLNRETQTVPEKVE